MIASERIVVFWSLVPMLVPMVCFGLGVGVHRVGRFFFVSSIILPGVLLMLPRLQVSPYVALAATLIFSSVVAMFYLALVPSARRARSALLVVLGLIDGAAILVSYLSQMAGIGIMGSVVLLAVTAAGVGSVAVWAARQFGRARGIEKG